MIERYRRNFGPFENPKGFSAVALKIITALGGDIRSGMCRCPAHDDDDPSLHVSTGRSGRLLVHCFAGCAQEAVINALRWEGLWPGSHALADDEAAPAAEEKRSPEERRAFALKVWRGLRGSEDMAQELVGPYMRSRGLTVPATARMILPIGACLEVGENNNKVRTDDNAGMVLPIHDKGGKFQGLQITYLNDDLTAKRENEPRRQTYGLLRGNFIHLGVDYSTAVEVLLVGEGAETVLSAMKLTGFPGIAAGGKVAEVDPPSAQRYIVLADVDDNGASRLAAGRFARRFPGKVQIAIPCRPEGGTSGYDFNDALVEAGDDEIKLAGVKRLIVEAPKFEEAMTKEEARDICLDELAKFYLQHGDGVDYYDRRKQVRQELNIPAGVLDKEINRRCEAIRAAQAKSQRPTKVDIAALEASAREIIDCKDVLGLFVREAAQIITGEWTNLQVLFLAGTSRLFGRGETIHCAMKGPSSVGKSATVEAVLKFFPPETIIRFNSLSEKGLFHMKEGFEHRILYMGEAAGEREHNQDFQDRMLRQLISEGRLSYLCVMKVGDKIESVLIEKEGPVASFVTTTRTRLNEENETRVLSLEIDDSEEQTRRVLRKIALTSGLRRHPDFDGVRRWHDFQRWLAAGPVEVIVPYAIELADLMGGTMSARMRRDFGQVLRAIQVHALIHREHRERDDRGRVLANIRSDYAVVSELLNGFVDIANELKVRKTTADVIAIVKELDEGGDEGGVTARQVGDRLRLSTQAASRRLKTAREAGYLTNLAARAGRGHEARYRATNVKLTAKDDALPLTDELEAAVAKRGVRDDDRTFEARSGAGGK
jgi:putative DNA primase/helicase